MQAVHEFGHVLGAWMTGGEVQRVVLHPLTISRTDLNPNPNPLFVVWAGPIGGGVIPLIVWLFAAALRLPRAFVLRFFAGFCLIANGTYLAIGSFEGIGDCGVMLRHGSARWQLWLFGAFTIPAGFALWHRQLSHFWPNANQPPVNSRVAYTVLTVALLLLALGFWIGGE